MKTLRTPEVWIPLYLFLLYWFYKKMPRYFFIIIIFSLLSFTLTDYISSGILKPFFERPRPCNEPTLPVRTVVGCGVAYGFLSSHAANHFGLASFWFFTILDLLKKKIYWFWAIAISYAQVYVGVHYPGDVTAGAFLGIVIGYICLLLFRFTRHKVSRKRNSPVSVNQI